MYWGTFTLVVSLAALVSCKPSFDGHSNGGGIVVQLMGIPGLDGYSKLQYPQYQVQDLGTIYEGSIPSDKIRVTNNIAIKIPKPYPVKVPHNVPIPVPVNQPYPVPVTKIIRVPQAVPIEVVKNVHVPVEVPKPYPVSESEYKNLQQSQLQSGIQEEYGGDHRQLSQALSSGDYSSQGYSNGYGNGGGWSGSGGWNAITQDDQQHHGEQADQSYAYPSVSQPVQSQVEQESHAA